MTKRSIGGKKSYAITMGLVIVALFLAYSVASADSKTSQNSTSQSSYSSNSSVSRNYSSSSSSSSSESRSSSSSQSSSSSSASASVSADVDVDVDVPEDHHDECKGDCHKHEEHHEDKCYHNCESEHIYKKVVAGTFVKRLPATGSSMIGLFGIAILAIAAAFGARKLYRTKLAK